MIRNVQVVEGMLKGQALMPGMPDPIEVTCDLEQKGSTDSADIRALRERAEAVLAGLVTGHWQTLINALVREMTDAAYEQSDYSPTEEDYRALAEELKLRRIAVYRDAVVLRFVPARNRRSITIDTTANSDWRLLGSSVVNP